MRSERKEKFREGEIHELIHAKGNYMKGDEGDQGDANDAMHSPGGDWAD